MSILHTQSNTGSRPTGAPVVDVRSCNEAYGFTMPTILWSNLEKHRHRSIPI